MLKDLFGINIEDTGYIPRCPLIVASSALMTDEIHSKCLKNGFTHATEVPIQGEFLKKIQNEIEQLNCLYEKNDIRKFTFTSSKSIKYHNSLANSSQKQS